MSDLDNAIKSINESAVKAENTADFLDDMSTFDDQSSVTNPNNGQTVASIPKQVKDRTDELFTASESEINQAVATTTQNASEAEQSASEAAQSAGEAATTVETQIRERVGIYKVGNISDYAGQQLQEAEKINSYQYPDNSDDWYGVKDGATFPITIPANPSSDNGWALINALTSYSLSNYTDIVYKASGGNSSVENMIAGVPIAADIDNICKTGGTTFKRVSKSNPSNLSDFIPLTPKLTTDFSSIQEAIDTYIEEVRIPAIQEASQSIDIKFGAKITGAGRDVINDSRNTELTFSGDGIIVGSNANYVNDASISKLRLVGDLTGVGLKLEGEIATPVNESTFKQLRIENFATGLTGLYGYSNVFENIRIQNCTKSFEFQSQSNNTSVTQLNASGGSQTSRFVNAEGMYLESFNWVNQTAPTTISLFQSYVTIDNPYFENLTGNVLIGAASETNASSLSLNGGLIAGDFIIGGNDVSLKVRGSRNAATQSKINSSNGVPDRYCTIDVNTKALSGEDADMNFKDWLLYTNSKENILWAGASGGSIRYSNLYRDYYEFEQQAANNGITIASNLVAGNQYCLVVSMRRDDATAQLSVRHGAFTLAFPDKACPTISSGVGFVTRHLPFVASATDLKLMFTGKVEIKGIAISRGIANSGSVDFDSDEKWRSSAVPFSGQWDRGDYVENSNPSEVGIVGAKYVVAGWRKITSGAGNAINVDWVECRELTGN
ncbi:coil containing protein [Vibrio phage 1.278.O._10N.286.54.E8]|nr:coil containing protein [Vibrio phage 1.278.O._10N.286.54.E8]